MALVKFGGGVIQMSGSIAGNTYARNRYGNYVRAKTKPVNPSSTRQQKVRSYIAELVERWYSILTVPQREAWKNYADAVAMKNKLGEVIKLSGFNHYIRSNTWRLDLGQVIVDDGPVVLTIPDQDGTIAVSLSAATQDVTVTFNDGLEWCSEDNAGIMILQGRPQNVTRNFFAGPYRGRSAKMGAVGVPIVSPQDYASIWVVAEGQKFWVKFRILRADGRLSQPFTANCIAAA